MIQIGIVTKGETRSQLMKALDLPCELENPLEMINVSKIGFKFFMKILTILPSFIVDKFSSGK